MAVILFSQRKVRGLSPPTAFPDETPAYPFQPSPTKVLSPPSEPKSRKSKKVKTSAKAKKPDLLERRPEPAVRIEPLVINETFDAPDYTESYELTKEPEAKPTKTAKKGNPIIETLFISCDVYFFHLFSSLCSYS